MPRRYPALLTWAGLWLLTAAAGARPALAQQGLVLGAVGPVNRSMGGAAAAAPIDASGALHWNPAAIDGLETSEMEFGLELAYPQARLASAVAPGTLVPGFPPFALAGSERSESGVWPLPTFGLVYRPCDTAWTYGLGVFTIGGFGVNYPASRTDPILTPQPPGGVGLGAVYSALQVMQIAPTVAYQLTEHIAIGFAPTIDLAHLAVDPALFAAPDDANGDRFPTYPAATHTRFHWGAGFQAGIYYTTDSGWNFGASFKSPQWLETFRFHSADELGRPRTIKFDVDYPMIASVGAAYAGFERWLFATDVRYIDYQNTDGFRRSGFDATGAVAGLGWDSILAVAAGVQYQWRDPLYLRLGYTFNENPIAAEKTVFNIASPTITQHILACGASYRVTDTWTVSLSYVHVFEAAQTGPIVSPFGPIPGSSVTSTIAADSLSIGASVQF